MSSLISQSIIPDIPKRVSSGTSTLQEERMPTNVAVDLSGHVTKENQNQHQTYKSKCFLFIPYKHAVTQTK